MNVLAAWWPHDRNPIVLVSNDDGTVKLVAGVHFPELERPHEEWFHTVSEPANSAFVPHLLQAFGEDPDLQVIEQRGGAWQLIVEWADLAAAGAAGASGKELIAAVVKLIRRTAEEDEEDWRETGGYL